MRPGTGLPVVGMVGGGQLARMTHQAAIALGQSLRVLAASPDDGAALVAADVTIGEHTDLAALRQLRQGLRRGHLRPRARAGGAHAPRCRGRAHRLPGADALLHAQDKRAMRERLAELGAAGAALGAGRPARSDVDRFAAETGWPVVAQGGPRRLRRPRRLDAGRPPRPRPSCSPPGSELIVEERVPLRRELAALVARSPFGQVAAYPVVETVQRDGICVEVLAPAPGPAGGTGRARPSSSPSTSPRELGVVGLLAVELFETDAGLLVNELAMRPHNSGHWTIEGARTSQFEQHLRAVLDYPMGETGLTAPAVAMANVLRRAGAGRARHRRAAAPPLRRGPGRSSCTSTASRPGRVARSAT